MATLLRSDLPAPRRDVLVFGSGAIGGAVLRRLRHGPSSTPLTFPVPWTEPARRRQALDEIGTALEQRALERPLSVVWAAGKAGFSATEVETARELEAYEDVVRMVARVPSGGPHAPHTFHLVSSAGGLFEGRAVRSTSEAPTPVRQYGHLKLAQEQLALRELSSARVAIYRPSSVYTGEGERLGLIGALVRNGIAHRPTTIVGALDTLRDYVHAADVGAHIADRALEDLEDGEDPRMLVCGHPASILQVIAAVEWALRRRLYIRMADSWNVQNITFSPAVKAARFVATPLEVGIRMVHARALGQPG